MITNDPLASFLINKCKLNPINFGFVSIVITFVIYFVIAWFTNTLVSKSGQIGFWEDTSIWVWLLLIQPVLFGYYLWEFDAIKRLLFQLSKSNVVEISNSDINLALKIHHKKWKIVLSTLVALAGGITYFESRSDVESWGSSGLPQKLSGAFLGIFSTYATSMLLIGMILNVWIIQKLLKDKEFKINPLHPDRCGGLSLLSDYSLKTAYLAAIFGIMIGFTEYRFITQAVSHKYWILHLGIPFYIIVSIACFFGPLLVAHNKMKEAKQNLLSNIANQFQDDYAQTNMNLSLSAEELNEKVAKIQELQSFYKLTDKFPEWPFDIQILRRYTISVVTPLIPPLVGLIQKIGGELLQSWGLNI